MGDQPSNDANCSVCRAGAGAAAPPPTPSPALRGSPYHPDEVARRSGRLESPGSYRYEGSEKHMAEATTARNGERSSPAPRNGQAALDHSIELARTQNGDSKRRIGVDPASGQIVVLDATRPEVGQFHGHVRTWGELDQAQRNALVDAGLADRRGNVIPPRPADADAAFRRASSTGGAEVDRVVYGVGGTPDAPEVYRFAPSGQYLGTSPIDRLPVQAEMGVSEQVLRMQNPSAPMRTLVSGPDGRKYAVGPGGVVVEDGGALRPLTPSERAALPRAVQSQLIARAAGPALALPDGMNGPVRQAAQRLHGNYVDAIDIHMQADQRRGGAAQAPTTATRPPGR